MNYRLVATDVGDCLKYASTINEIDRKGKALFYFQKESFPNASITSVRAQCIYDWVLTLAKQAMENSKRNELLLTFCEAITPSEHIEEINKILKRSGIDISQTHNLNLQDFMQRNLHTEIHKHSKKLFSEGHFFYAVFEACKAYNKLVQQKAQSNKDGQALMLEVWGADNGVLKITPCKTETDKNIQNGVKFLSAGLMQAIRNPTAHEPALDWPINKQDCLDFLSFLSFLFRKLDDAVYFKV